MCSISSRFPTAIRRAFRTTLEFFEVNSEGAPIDEQRRQFEIEGDRVYVECLVAKFEDKYVEQADLDRATAICLFQRIFGEYQQPQDGFRIDEIGSSPTSYARGGKMSEFEKTIWKDFWEFASNPQKSIRHRHSRRTRRRTINESEARGNIPTRNAFHWRDFTSSASGMRVCGALKIEPTALAAGSVQIGVLPDLRENAR